MRSALLHRLALVALVVGCGAQQPQASSDDPVVTENSPIGGFTNGEGGLGSGSGSGSSCVALGASGHVVQTIDLGVAGGSIFGAAGNLAIAGDYLMTTLQTSAEIGAAAEFSVVGGPFKSFAFGRVV